MKILIAFFCLFQLVISMYMQACLEGFYSDGNICKPGDSSCKTGSNRTSGDSCHDYLFVEHLNPNEFLCQRGEYGEYFDSTQNVCRSGDINGDGHQTGKEKGNYQTQCFECPESQYFDLETLSCISDGFSPKVTITGIENANIQNIGRLPDYYVDPQSTKNLELGTLQYPYKSFKSVTSDLLNFHSNSERSITIFGKDVYVEFDTAYFINISSVSIKSHPSLSEFGKRALLIPTRVNQPGLSTRTLFSLLTNSSFDYDTGLKNVNFNFTNFGGNYPNTVFYVFQTTLKLENIDFYTQEAEAYTDMMLILPVMMEENWLIISKLLIPDFV